MYARSLLSRRLGAFALALVIPVGAALAQQGSDPSSASPRWEPSGPMMGGRMMGQGMGPGMGGMMGQGMGPGMGGMMGHGPCDGMGPMAWMGALDLSVEQRDQLRALHRRHRVEALEARGRVRTAKRAMHGLAHQYEPDLVAVEAAFDLLSEARKAALMQRLKARAEVDAVLTESQQLQLRGLGKGHGPGHHGSGHGGHQGAMHGGMHRGMQGGMGGGMAPCAGGAAGMPMGRGMGMGMGMDPAGQGAESDEDDDAER